MFVFLALIMTVCQGILFDFGLEKRELRCFGDNLGKNVLVVGHLIGSAPEYSFKIHLPNKKADNIIHYSNSQEITKFSFTTNKTAENYQYCVHNLGQTRVQFKLDYQTGAEAMDYTLLAQKEDLQPIELLLKKLNNLIEAIHSDQKSIDEQQGNRFDFVQVISYKILLFSGLTLGLMVLVNLYQSHSLKKFFKQRKLI